MSLLLVDPSIANTEFPDCAGHTWISLAAPTSHPDRVVGSGSLVRQATKEDVAEQDHDRLKDHQWRKEDMRGRP